MLHEELRARRLLGHRGVEVSHSYMYTSSLLPDDNIDDHKIRDTGGYNESQRR